MSATTFIYALNDPETGECRYIGKADDPHDRLFSNSGHLYESRSAKKRSHRINWIKSLTARGLVPFLEILQEVRDTEWELWERIWIKTSRAIGINLTNTTDGGEGGCTTLGRKHKPESLAKMSVWQLGKRFPKKGAWQFGRKHKTNTSGFVGTTRCYGVGKWQAHFQSNGKKFNVGRFLKLEDAVFARALAVALQ